MDKEKLYHQIHQFKQELANRFYKDVEEIDSSKGFYYVNDSNAKDKAEFIDFLINNNYLKNNYSTIIDLAFGSGNLTSHIIFDNKIKYERLIFNDLNIINTNQNIVRYIDSSYISNKDMLNLEDFKDEKVDLVIVNPQIGGKYKEGDIKQQKKEKETEQDLYKRFGEVLYNFLNSGSTVLFYGDEKDFKSILPNVKYIQYKSKLKDLFVVKKDLEKSLCFEKEGNNFVECKNNSSENSEYIESLDEIEIELSEYEIKKSEAKVEEKSMKNRDKHIFNKNHLGNLDFDYKNILFKGVPGTGKSRAIDNIIKKLGIENKKENTLRINIHSASSNADLMQGIGIATANGQIEYKEKQGLIFNLIKRATFNPNQPFVLVLEEIQENSLNELIGDLIYLIEDDKRANLQDLADDKEYAYQELINRVVEQDSSIKYVEIPYLVSDSTEYRKMILPNNLFIFCTSNYRDDKKVIEDNLLRRFEVVEIYPKNSVASAYSQEFFSSLNKVILEVFQDEIHPDRYMIGHAIWKDVESEKDFYRAILKVVTEFKDIKEIEFETVKEIFNQLQDSLPENIDSNIAKQENYYNLITVLQDKIGYEFSN